jgi:hypothetical protein
VRVCQDNVRQGVCQRAVALWRERAVDSLCRETEARGDDLELLGDGWLARDREGEGWVAGGRGVDLLLERDGVLSGFQSRRVEGEELLVPGREDGGLVFQRLSCRGEQTALDLAGLSFDEVPRTVDATWIAGVGTRHCW